MSSRHSEGAQRYLNHALELIDARGGSHGVNLREVARALGFSHTNAYNWFANREALLADAQLFVLEQQVTLAEEVAAGRGSAMARLDRLVERELDFALEHPGWYRFLWLEPLGEPPSPEVEALLLRAGATLTSLVREASPRRLTATQARRLSEDLHIFVHGAFCKAIAERDGGHVDRRRKLIRTIRRVQRMLMGEAQS